MQKLFLKKALPTYDNIRKAIGAFERTLITPLRLDDYLGGNINTLSSHERQGLKIFIDQDVLLVIPDLY